MADNVTADAGSGGATFAADDISGVHYPRTKIVIGADGTNDGDVSSANPLPVTVSGTVTVGSHAVTNAGTFAVQAAQSGTWTVTGTGGTFPVTDSGGSLTVDAPVGTPVFVRLSDGTDPITTLAVSLASVPSHAVTNAGTFAVQAAQSGTWTVDLGATDNAVLDAIAASLAGTLTVGSHAVTNAGTFAVQVDGAALTALQIMDDWDNAASDGASVSGDVAHDTADAGEPVKQGFKATTALSGLTLVAANDRTDGFAGIDGAQIVRPHTVLEDIATGNASNTDGTSTQCIAAQAAGIKTYLTTIILTNTSASDIYVEIKDGATAKLTIPVPAGGGAVCNLPVPLPGSAATAWNFDPSAATTTVYCSMIGFKSKV